MVARNVCYGGLGDYRAQGLAALSDSVKQSPGILARALGLLLILLIRDSRDSVYISAP